MRLLDVKCLLIRVCAFFLQHTKVKNAGSSSWVAEWLGKVGSRGPGPNFCFVLGVAFAISQAAQRAPPQNADPAIAWAPRAHGAHAPTAGATATPQRSSRRHAGLRDPRRRRTQGSAGRTSRWTTRASQQRRRQQHKHKPSTRPQPTQPTPEEALKKRKASCCLARPALGVGSGSSTLLADKRRRRGERARWRWR
jgi:hypothetical protein